MLGLSRVKKLFLVSRITDYKFDKRHVFVEISDEVSVVSSNIDIFDFHFESRGECLIKILGILDHPRSLRRPKSQTFGVFVALCLFLRNFYVVLISAFDMQSISKALSGGKA